MQTAIESNVLDPVAAAQDGTSVAACAARRRMINQETLWWSVDLAGSLSVRSGPHRARMADPDVLKLYSQGGQTVEWGFADARAHRGLQRFRGRGEDFVYLSCSGNRARPPWAPLF
jgi:hypothetical protein